MSRFDDTIVALSTAPISNSGALAIVRVSGGSTRAVIKRITGGVPEARTATFKQFYDYNKERFDSGILLFFESPKSFTGEDLAEFHIHGSDAVVEILIESCLKCSNSEALIRHARPGEFSERAFLNGKIDLAQAEAISELIGAKSRNVVKALNRILSGEYGEKINNLGKDILKIRSEVEVQIDFSAEDVGSFQAVRCKKSIDNICSELNQLIKQGKEGKKLNQVFKVVIAGPPNVGKSSLLNTFLNENRAIVNSNAGTTRDLIKSELILAKCIIELSDTAGFRETKDPVEKEGIKRTFDACKNADLILFLLDRNCYKKKFGIDWLQLVKTLEKYTKVFIIINKTDTTSRKNLLSHKQKEHQFIYGTSTKTRRGLDDLKIAIEEVFASEQLQNERTDALSLNQRSLSNMGTCVKYLQSAKKKS